MTRSLRFDVRAAADGGQLVQMAGQARTLIAQLRALGRTVVRARAELAVRGADDVTRADVALRGLDRRVARGRADVEVRGIDQVTQADVALRGVDRRVARGRAEVTATGADRVAQVDTALTGIDGRRAQAAVAVTGTDRADRDITQVVAALAGLPSDVRTAVRVDVDPGIVARVRSMASGIESLRVVSQAAAAGVGRLRAVAQGIVEPGQIPMVLALSDAIGARFHAAADRARVVVDGLHRGVTGLTTGMLGLGAAGNAAAAVGSVVTAVAQLSGIALAAPGALLAAAAAVGTFKIAFAGFGDAVAAKDLKEFTEATKGMAPAAVQAASTVRGLKERFSEVKQVVQTNFFKSFATEAQALGGRYLPLLKTGLGDVATGLGGMTSGLSRALLATPALGAVKTILGQTGVALSRMKDTAGSAATGLLTLGSAGAAYLPRLAAWIDRGAASFAAWTQRITSDGSFDRWVEGGITAAKQLGTLLGNLGRIGGSVFDAFNTDGAGLFATLVTLTGELDRFLRTAEGSAALRSFAGMLQAAGSAASGVFMAALRALAPLITAIGPAMEALATAVSHHLITAIERATPYLERLAQWLSENPQLLAGLAQAAGVAAIAFGPLVVVLGVLAGALRNILLVRLVAGAMGALGLQGTYLAAVLGHLAAPLTLLRTALPLLAAAAGRLAAGFVLSLGPAGVLLGLLGLLYVSSAQFRDAVGGIASTLAGLFLGALRDAGGVLVSTVGMITAFVGALAAASEGARSFGSGLLSWMGPAGAAIEGFLTGVSGALGNLPGITLAAIAAFLGFRALIPLFGLLSTAVTTFGARLAAASLSSGVITTGVNAAGQAVSKFGGFIQKAGAALPILGIALVALGAIYDSVRDRSTEAADSVISGSSSMSQAIQQQADALANQAWWVEENWATWDQAAESQKRYGQATDDVNRAIDAQLNTMTGMSRLQGEATVAQARLNDAIANHGPRSREAAEATAAYRVAQDRLETAQTQVADATRDHEQAIQDLADQMSSQVGAALAYEQAVARTAESHRAAQDALKENGAGSAEYAASVLDLAVAMDSQAQAARRQAEALGGPTVGLEAYNLEVLRSADLTTQAGRDAFTKFAGSLDATGLAALSATAQMSGLRTEVITLPDGRTVTVVTAADRAALDDVKATVQEVTAQEWVGTIRITSDSTTARGDIQQTVEFANGVSGTVRILADGSPAQVEIQGTKYLIDAATGTMKIQGDPTPGHVSLDGLRVAVNSATGEISILAADAPAQGTLQRVIALTNGAKGTVTIDGNGAPASAVLNGAKYRIDGTTGTLTIDGNPAPGQADLSGLKASIDRSTGTLTIQGRDGGVAALKARLAANTSSTHTIYVQQKGGKIPIAYHGGVFAGGVQMMHDGGVMVAMAAGGVRRIDRMQAGRAAVVPPGRERVVTGDRDDVDELYVPLSRSLPRSHSLLRYGAGRMGYDLVPRVTVPGHLPTPVMSSMPLSGRSELGPLLAQFGALRGALLAVASGADASEVVAELRTMGGRLAAALKTSVADEAQSRRVTTALTGLR